MTWHRPFVSGRTCDHDAYGFACVASTRMGVVLSADGNVIQDPWWHICHWRENGRSVVEISDR